MCVCVLFVHRIYAFAASETACCDICNSVDRAHTSAHTGAQLRVQRPAARRPAARFVARNASGEGGSKGEGRESTMGQNQQAQNDVEQMAAPEGDRVLEGAHLLTLCSHVMEAFV